MKARVEKPTLPQRLAAEALGTAFLLATVVGSGIMAQRLAGGNVALALLGNTIPTGAILAVLILIFGPVSGAHMNPAVSLAMTLRRHLSAGDLALFVAAQIAGGFVGVLAAHAMFDLPLLQVSSTLRTGGAQWFAEAVATFGLLLTIFGCIARAPLAAPYAIGLYITAAYWFTASTSFANPAVTVARAFSDTFAGSLLPAFLPSSSHNWPECWRRSWLPRGFGRRTPSSRRRTPPRKCRSFSQIDFLIVPKSGGLAAPDETPAEVRRTNLFLKFQIHAILPHPKTRTPDPCPAQPPPNAKSNSPRPAPGARKLRSGGRACLRTSPPASSIP